VPELIFQEDGPDGLLPDGPDDLVAVKVAVDDNHNLRPEHEQPLERSAHDPNAELALSRVIEPYKNMDLAMSTLAISTLLPIASMHFSAHGHQTAPTVLQMTL